MYSGHLPALNLKVINDRIDNPSCGPNRLILEVSITEGLARTILIKLLIVAGKRPEQAFKFVDELKIREVFKMIFDSKQISGLAFFNSPDWEKFDWAIAFRNFLVHHGAFVGGQTSAPLINAAVAVRKKIKDEWI